VIEQALNGHDIRVAPEHRVAPELRRPTVVLGNSSAGGAYPAPLLPTFWRAISPALPNGAGVQALRRIVYFGSYNITDNLLIISLYIVTAAGIALTGTTLLARRAAAGKPTDAVV